MLIFVFDTETTGFINKKETDIQKQPHIIQFAGILGTIEKGVFTEKERINLMFHPGVPIPFDASQVHHIYDMDVQDAPRIEEKLDSLLFYINTSDIVIGHNIEYDEGMIRLELQRLGKTHEYNPKQTLCTMKTTVDFCAIKSEKRDGFKYPKLGELYKKIFGEYFVGAHDALVDVEMTLKCFLELNKLGVLSLQSQEKARLSLF